MIKIKNNKQDSDVWVGQLIEPGQYHELQSSETSQWANNSKVLSDIGSGNLIVNDGIVDISDVAKAISYLLGNNTKTVFSEQFAFAQKVTKEGKKLFRRKHGTKKIIVANSTDTLELVVPYPLAKINQAEIMNCSAGDTVDLRVYDTASGTISTVPNYMLNQFGFGVIMPNGTYVDESNYDADLIQGMKIQISYTNNSSEPREIGLNITLHQVV